MKIQEFVNYALTLKGDEKGEAQVFCDRLFIAFGHQGYKQAGAILEHRIKSKKKTLFADLLWQPKLLLEMKKRGEKIQRHYRQIFEYWLQLVPQRPQYVVVCNFDEFWIYDFNYQLEEPVDKIKIEELPQRYTALNFLFPDNKKPQFGNDLVAVTRAAADKVAGVFNLLIQRKEDRLVAQRFILQTIVALFAEDIDLLPRGIFSEILQDCLQGQSSYDLIGNLFRQMSNPIKARAGRYQNVAYFNGGIFEIVEPIPLLKEEIELLIAAAKENWSKIQPGIFGTLFENSMDKKERHAYGAHFTTEADIEKVILPTIVTPWRDRLDKANTLKELLELRQALLNFRVLDPACGSGNFLYIAYRRLKLIEAELINKIQQNFSQKTSAALGTMSLISTRQFYGIDNNFFAVELAKVTLMLAKKLALNIEQMSLPLELEPAIPLDNLNQNIICDDALFCDWPEVDVIIGNPPYQSKNKMQQEYGAAYVKTLREKYPEVPGRADYCVYWFRRTQDQLKPGGRAGLVATNTIRQNYSREGGLEYIVNNGGTITEAVATQVWSGDAVVHVSIVNWLKGTQAGKKKLYTQLGDSKDSHWEVIEVMEINSALSAKIDLTCAKILLVNQNSGICYQGQTHGHEGFLLTADEAALMLEQSPKNSEIIFPYLSADNLLAGKNTRYIIDFYPRDILSAKKYTEAFKRIEKLVLPTRMAAAEEEKRRNQAVLENNPKAKVNKHHQNFLAKWWLLSYPRGEMIEKIQAIPRYIVCSRVTKRPIFEFIDSNIRPNDSLQVFTLSDDYSFGILQSNIHWAWFTARCSTLKGDFRYTSNTVFDTFPGPQQVNSAQIKKVAEAAVKLREFRHQVMKENQWSLRELYRTLDLPGNNPLKKLHEELDKAVCQAYGLKPSDDPLQFLLELNLEIAKKEALGENVISPVANILDSKYLLL